MKEGDALPPAPPQHSGNRGRGARIAGAIVLSGLIVAGAVLLASSKGTESPPSPQSQASPSEVSSAPSSPSPTPVQATSASPTPAEWHALEATEAAYNPVWAVYVTIGRAGSPELDHAVNALNEMGVPYVAYNALACDTGALDALGLRSGVAVGAYFADEAQATAFAEAYGAGAYPPVQVAPECGGD